MKKYINPELTIVYAEVDVITSSNETERIPFGWINGNNDDIENL